MTFVSYAQNFEDIMLHRALKGVRHGFYVDVGAQHPVKDSVTKAFSLAGWRGINIEPVKHWFDMLAADRPHDINLNLAVAEHQGFLELFDVEGTGLSTTDAEFAETHRREGREIAAYKVPTRTLDSIFEEYVRGDVHFLKVDCEGAERTALASCSFLNVRPWIVVVEATLPNSQVSVHDQWEALLTDRDYMLAYRDGLNRYYVAAERSELLDAFDVPPNVFDDFVRVGDQAAHEGFNEAHVRLRAAVVEAAEAKGLAHSLAHHLDALRAQYLEWRESDHHAVVELSKEREALQVELADAKVLHDKLKTALAAREQQVAEQRAAIAAQRANVRGNEQIDELRRRQVELLREVEALKGDRALRDALIGSLVHSTSWRITSPLRAGRILGGKAARRLWNLGRPFIARTARASRPVVRRALKVPGVRRVAGAVLGADSRLGRRVRSFLFPFASARLEVAPLALTEEALAVEAMLQRAIARRDP